MLFKIWRGGLVFYGGLISALIVAGWYMRRNKMPVLITLDIFAPAIAIGHAIGRIGCFLAGCCHGRVADHSAWYTLIFPTNASSFAPAGVALYPTQLMEVFGETLIFLTLFVLRRYKRFDGQIIAVYAMLYAILRSCIEVFRGDIERGFVIEPWLSTSQFVSLFVFTIGLGMYLKLSSRQKKLMKGE
jgi:phosphatidylglycerol---prolipoprotein diacylglyceryl transferase